MFLYRPSVYIFPPLDSPFLHYFYSIQSIPSAFSFQSNQCLDCAGTQFFLLGQKKTKHDIMLYFIWVFVQGLHSLIMQVQPRSKMLVFRSTVLSTFMLRKLQLQASCCSIDSDRKCDACSSTSYFRTVYRVQTSTAILITPQITEYILVTKLAYYT